MPQNVNSDGVLSAPLGGHKALVAVIVLLSIVIIGGGSVWAYFTYIKPTDTQVLPSNLGNVPVITTVPTTTDASAVVPILSTSTNRLPSDTTSTDSRILFGEPVLDTDSDGLDDNVEKELGTNMLAWDTDGDTLSDGEEVLTWKTNPLKIDTDGDTYSDASEIKNGYNPLGEGKLFTINATSTSSGTTTNTSLSEIKP